MMTACARLCRPGSRARSRPSGERGLAVPPPSRIPSLISSPRIRSAPQVLFSVAIVRINAMVSAASLRSAPQDLLLRRHRNPSRCHRRTVSGWTMATTRCHPGNVAALTMSLNLSSGISLGRGTLRRSTTIGCRSNGSPAPGHAGALPHPGQGPTTTPSATGPSFAHSHQQTGESIWPTA